MAKPKESIEDIIRRAVEAGKVSAERTARDAFKATEKRLYALPALRIKVQDDEERLAEIKQYGPRSKSKDIVRFQKGGIRLSPEEILEAAIIDMEATIAADRYEVETLERALKHIEDDLYYPSVSGKYFDGLADDAVAEVIHCDPTTVWRNRKRLVQRVAVFLYGVEAVR